MKKLELAGDEHCGEFVHVSSYINKGILFAQISQAAFDVNHKIYAGYEKSVTTREMNISRIQRNPYPAVCSEQIPFELVCSI